MSWLKNICFLFFTELTKMRPVLIWDINTTRRVTNIPEEGRSRPLRGGTLKSREVIKLLLWPPRKKPCSRRHTAQSVLLSLWANTLSWISWPGCWCCWMHNVRCQCCVVHCILLHLVQMDVISGLDGINWCSGVRLCTHAGDAIYNLCVGTGEER